MPVVRMHIGDAEGLASAYESAAAEVRESLALLSPLVTEALSLLDRPGQNPAYGPMPALHQVASDLKADERDLAWRIEWLVTTDAQPLGVTGRVAGFAPADLDAAFTATGLTGEQIETARNLVKRGVSFEDAVLAAQSDDPQGVLDALRIAELNERIDNWSGSDNDPILDALIKERRELIEGPSTAIYGRDPSSLTDEELSVAIARWHGRDNDPILHALVSERSDRLRTQSVEGSAEALGIPVEYAEFLVDALSIPPGEILVGFGGIDVSREDIAKFIEASPVDYQFDGFLAALAATAVTESQLAELEAVETSAVAAFNAWSNGDSIDEDDLAEHGLVLETAGIPDWGTWRVIRNEQGIAIAAWYDTPHGTSSFEQMSLAQSTAEYRRGLATSTEADEIYQSFLDSGAMYETNASAFAFMQTGDEELAVDIGMGAWPGGYLGVVTPSAITDPHIWLDGIGLIPLVGEVADIANAALYVIEGDLGNAGISVASTIPFLGGLGPARRAATQLGGEVIDSVQVLDGTAIHTIRRSDGTLVQIVELTDGQIVGGPSTLVQRHGREVNPNVLSGSGGIPGGGLAAHEAAGGHTLSRHVGKTPDELADRLDNSNVPAASSFDDLETAESAISAAIDANESQIQNWLANGARNDQSAFTYQAGEDIGISYVRGAAGAVGASNVKIVLRPDSAMPSGYRILTAFPE